MKIWTQGKKVQFSTDNGGLWLENSTNLHFQYYTELFFLEFKFWFFFAGQLRVTVEDYCISLNPNNFFFGCVGSCGYVPWSVKCIVILQTTEHCNLTRILFVPLKMQIFISYFLFSWIFLLQKKNRQMKAGQNNKYDITNTLGLVLCRFGFTLNSR